ncbi:DUF3152 domain-containing protein [Streptomyces sp. E11-3]|uniref:DUF3152 domain-containing protein n=1 Tax=Streptomyces sp. E11-3 TaxID=3110112 RepID=UPI00397F8DF1
MTGAKQTAQSARAHRERRRRTPRVHPGRVLATSLAIGGFGACAVALLPQDRGPEVQQLTAPAPLRPAPATTPAEPSPPEPRAEPGSRSSPRSAPSPAGSPSSAPVVPATGRGTFTTGSASGATAGSGRIWRYQVEVEDGTRLSADKAAREVAAVLADPRGWAAKGTRAFQLVTSGRTDFRVRIATPATVDRLCGEYGLDTGGEVNCRVGTSVVVNLKRWMLGSPKFDGPLSEYRALIINHEVGHRLGHGHLTCAGPGHLAPAMMQQIKGLHGCVANAWPFDEHGTYIDGPKAD